MDRRDRYLAELAGRGPVILTSLWLAATEQPAASLAAARQDWAAAHGELAGTGVMPGFWAVAAMLGLLGGDQQVIVRMFGALRLPEADLAAVCAATGLSRTGPWRRSES